MPDVLGEVSFQSLVDPQKWHTLDEHITRIDAEMDADIAETAHEDKILYRELRDQLTSEYSVKTVSDSQREAARSLLMAGKVVAIDGTRTTYQLLAGARCRIGVVAVSYRGERTESVLYVSEQTIRVPEFNPLEILRKRRPENSVLSSMVAGAIMAYMERSIALGRPEEWKLLNGPLMPYELRTGLGRLRALGPCLDLMRQMIQQKKIAGISGTSTSPDIPSVGLALRPGEYVRLGSIRGELDEYLYGSQDEGIGARSAAKFSGQDRKTFADFIEECGQSVDYGLIRAGSRPYVFHAYRDVFDEVASILMTDSEMQPLRSYPLLIDYADSLCSRVFSGGDFRKLVEMKLSKLGGFEIELPEQVFRRR